jgi:transcription termination/antitermination protein NusG
MTEETPENRVATSDEPSPGEAAPPPERVEDAPAPEEPESEAVPEPEDVGAPTPEEAATELLEEPADREVQAPADESLPQVERERVPAEVEAVTVQEPEEAVTAEAEVPAAAKAAEEAPPEEQEGEEEEESPPPEEGEEFQEAGTATADLFAGTGDWYVIHTYAGYENKVKTNLESRIHTMQMEEKIFDVHIPMEDVMEIKGGKKQVVQKKVFPGYLLVKMVYDDDSWYVVRNTPGVTGFVSSGTGQRPTPLSRREVEKILTVKEEEAKKPAFRLEYEEGDVVRIISGPFADFNGTISDINVDQSKLRVMVNIFDRETPVELGFDQVAKV